MHGQQNIKIYNGDDCISDDGSLCKWDVLLNFTLKMGAAFSSQALATHSTPTQRCYPRPGWASL